MKHHILDFIRRGMAACGIGPIVLAVVYLILQRNGQAQMLTVNQVCLGIFSLTALSFIAGGMNCIYQIERLPLMVAILIHGCVLYISYLITYLINGWLERDTTPILAFSAVFVLGYLVIWVVIYSGIKKKTDTINEMLKKNRKCEEDSP